MNGNKRPLKISGKVAGCVVKTLKTFQGTHILGALRGRLCDNSTFLLFVEEICTWEAVAVAQLGNDMFVLQKSPLQLDVYDAVSLILRGNIIIPTVGYSFGHTFVDMVACCHYRCLYFADQGNSHIVRLEIPPKLSEWQVEGINSWSSMALSVTSSHHLLVLCPGSNRPMLKLFSTEGVLYKTVELQTDLGSVSSAVELTPGKYVVTRDSALHQVCVINHKGKILHNFGGLQGSYGKLLTTLRDVAVDKDGFVYVDDVGSNRLVLLTPKLDYLHCMPNVFTQSLDNCRRMKLDKNCGHIYVVHSAHENRRRINRVTVFQI